jgi:hypothetical protein
MKYGYTIKAIPIIIGRNNLFFLPYRKTANPIVPKITQANIFAALKLPACGSPIPAKIHPALFSILSRTKTFYIISYHRRNLSVFISLIIKTADIFKM